MISSLGEEEAHKFFVEPKTIKRLGEIVKETIAPNLYRVLNFENGDVEHGGRNYKKAMSD